MNEILGGSVSPIGWSVGWIEAPLPDVLDATLSWREALGWQLEIERLRDVWPDCLLALSPLEAPWTVELFVAHKSSWTCYLNNNLGGGDPSPVTSYISQALGTRGVVSVHQPMGPPPRHASTQFELFSPDGEPPLMCQRVLAAHAEDGRWSWYAGGEQLAFEHPDRYQSRLKRDRLDRPLLVEYLGALGIDVDKPEAFGASTLVRQVITWRTRKQSLAEARADLGLA